MALVVSGTLNKQRGTIRCPRHALRFALQDGSVREGTACAALACYETRIAGNPMQIRIRP